MWQGKTVSLSFLFLPSQLSALTTYRQACLLLFPWKPSWDCKRSAAAPFTHTHTVSVVSYLIVTVSTVCVSVLKSTDKRKNEGVCDRDFDTEKQTERLFFFFLNHQTILSPMLSFLRPSTASVFLRLPVILSSFPCFSLFRSSVLWPAYCSRGLPLLLSAAHIAHCFALVCCAVHRHLEALGKTLCRGLCILAWRDQCGSKNEQGFYFTQLRKFTIINFEFIVIFLSWFSFSFFFWWKFYGKGSCNIIFNIMPQLIVLRCPTSDRLPIIWFILTSKLLFELSI